MGEASPPVGPHPRLRGDKGGQLPGKALGILEKLALHGERGNQLKNNRPTVVEQRWRATGVRGGCSGS